MEVIGKIYCWFESLFGKNLAEYLWGWDCQAESYINRNLFNYIGIISSIIIVFSIATYYYFLDHPRLNRFKWWALWALITSFINFLLAGFWVQSHFLNERIGECLMYEEEVQRIFLSDCWWFGFVNFILSLILFVFLSLFAKLGSRNCKYSPF